MRSDSISVVADCPWVRRDERSVEEQAASYVQERERLLEALSPGSPERLMFLANFPADYATACQLRPSDTVPLPTHEGSDAIN